MSRDEFPGEERGGLNASGAGQYIEPGSPGENGYIERFNSKLRDELLNGEILDSLREAKVLIEHWRREYNEIPPHQSLGGKPPAPEAIEPWSLVLGLTWRLDPLLWGRSVSRPC